MKKKEKGKKKKENSVLQVANRGSSTDHQLVLSWSARRSATPPAQFHETGRNHQRTCCVYLLFSRLPAFHSTRFLSPTYSHLPVHPSILTHTHSFFFPSSFPLPLTLLPPTHPHPTLTRPTVHWPFPLQPALRFHPIPARAPPIGSTVFRRPLPNPALPPRPLFSHPFPSYLVVHPQQQPPNLDSTIRFPLAFLLPPYFALGIPSLVLGTVPSLSASAQINQPSLEGFSGALHPLALALSTTIFVRQQQGFPLLIWIVSAETNPI